MAEGGVEVRIHGIGNHDTLSSLGSPIDLDGTYVSTVDLQAELLRPVIPNHRLWLLYWSRASRRLTDPLWLFALPFTILNTGGHAGPQSPLARRVHTTLTVTFGIVLTVGAFFWTVVISETIMVKFNTGRVFTFDWFKVLLCVVTLAWLAGMARQVKAARAMSPDAISRLGIALAWVHALAITVAACAIWLLEPGRTTQDALAAPCLIGSAGQRCVVFQGDWTTVFAGASMGAAGLLGLACMAVSWIPSRGWQDRKADPWLATGLTLIAGTTLLHVVASTIRSLAEQIFFEIGLAFPYHPQNPPLKYAAIQVGLLRTFDYSGLPYTGMDLVALGWGPILWLALLWFAGRRVIGWAATKYNPSGTYARQARAATARHRWITGASVTGYVLVTTVFLVVASLCLLFVLQMAVRQHELAANPQDALNAYYTDIRNTAFRFLELSTSWVFISLLVVAIFSGSTRAALGVIGDVLGYWAITYHPLAGHPYRFRVLDRGVAELTKVDGALVIVGHSQGSVLALDLIGRLRVLDSDRRLSLVTCGSPLDSLYARFFPLVFTSQTSGEVQAAVGGRWTNFWRKTDPIATPIPGIPSPGNVEIAEEGRADPRHPLRAHSDYWIEPKQQAQVREYLRPDGEVT